MEEKPDGEGVFPWEQKPPGWGPEDPDEFADDAVDPELMKLARSRSQGSVLRPLLMVAVIGFGAFLINQWHGQIAYFFTPSKPVAIGSVTNFASKVAKNPAWKPPIPDNRYVSISGIPERRSHSRKYDFVKLVGGQVYVQIPRTKHEEKRSTTERSAGDMNGIDRTFFTGKGRALEFAKMPDRYQGLREYYESRYHTRFCEEFTKRDLAELQRRRTQRIIRNWRREYEGATAKERAQNKLTPKPTGAQIRKILDDNPVCEHAYLIQDGVTPRDHWWYVAVAGLIGAFMLFNVFMLIRWVRNLVRE